MRPFPLVPLLDICFPKQWKTLSSEEMLPTGFPVYGANGQIGYYSEFTHEEPTLMITCRGATCGTINLSMPFSYIGGNAMALDRLDPHRVDRGYLYHCLQHRGFRDEITGAAQPQITRQNLARVEIPLPPLDEQRRIAAILDKADALRRKRKRAIELLDSLTKSIFLEMFGDPIENPKGLPSKRLYDVASFVSGGTPSKSVEDYWSGSIPWVSPKDMKVTEISDAEDHVSKEALTKTSLKSIPPESVLLVVRGMILAHTVPLAMTRVPTTINQDMKAIRFHSNVDSVFGLWCLKAQHRHILTKVSSAAHGTKRLDMDDVERLPILLPSEQKQTLFVGAATNVARSRKCAMQSAESIHILFSSLQSRAFFGEF